jgi:hypothetical protein
VQDFPRSLHLQIMHWNIGLKFATNAWIVKLQMWAGM